MQCLVSQEDPSYILQGARGTILWPEKKFNCVIGGISKGFIGNKRGEDFIKMKNSISGFDMEGASVSPIKYQNYGSKKLYSNGRLCKPTFSRPKYFSTGECITNIDDQHQLVGELIGRPPIFRKILQRGDSIITSAS